MTHPSDRMSEVLGKIRDECGPLKCRLCGDTNSIVVENDVGRRETVACPECSTRQLRTDLAAANERAERAEERSQYLLDRQHIFHECRGVVRTYPAALCSMHSPKCHAGEDFDAKEKIDTLRTQLAEAEVLLHGARQIIEAHADPEAPAFAGPRHELVGSWHNEISVFIETLSRLTTDADASGEGVGK